MCLQADEGVTTGRGWSVNLDIFRIVFLGAVAFPWAIRNLNWTYTILPGLPREIWSTISFYQLIPYEVLSNVSLTKVLVLMNLLFIFLGLIGVCTRTAITFALILSLYLFGLPENQGHVDHWHHIIWFQALLAVGPSGRFLSVDSIRKAIRRADGGYIEAPIQTFDALWTLRYVWLMLGLLYLIPGVAKLVKTLTMGWASAPNLRNVLWAKWFEGSLFVPGAKLPLRADLLPSQLLEIAGLGVIAFEIGFLLVVLFRWLRPWLAIAGVGFHVGNGFILRIWFTTLIPIYICLIDWASIGRVLYRKKGPLLVLYDGDCQLCRRTIAILKTLDLFEVLEPKPITNDSEMLDQFPGISYELLLRDLHAVASEKTAAGYDAYILIARHLFALWPVSFLMRFPPIAWFGRKVYRRVAVSRHCALVPPKPRRDSIAEPEARLVHVFGIALLACQLAISSIMFLDVELHGFTSQLPARASRAVWRIARWKPVWPFASYPTFAEPTPDVIEIWEARWVLPEGEVRVSPDAYAAAFGNSGLVWHIVNTACTETDPGRFRNLSIGLTRTLWQTEKPEIRASVTKVRVYRVRYHLGPYDPPATLLSETLMNTFPVDAT